MSSRLTSQLLVTALMRRVQAAGGMAMVLCKGEPISGTIVIQTMDRGQITGLFERVTDLDGVVTLVPCGPADVSQDVEVTQYIERRRRVDPDIWFIELDIAEAQRLAAEHLCSG